MSHLPTGVYRISRWGTHERPQILTHENGKITVVPSGAVPEPSQEWGVENVSEGKVVIQNPGDVFPSSSLSYEGEPERGKKIIPGRLSDFPTRDWRVEAAPQLPLPAPYFIRVPDKDLIVEFTPLDIFPPQLALGPAPNDLANAWVFELLRTE